MFEIPITITHETSIPSTAHQHLLTLNSYELDKDWKLEDFFGSVLVISLPDAAERLQKLTEELQNIGTHTFLLFPAIDGRKDLDPSIWNKLYLNLHNIDTTTEEGRLALDRLHQGQAGCFMSHYKALQTVKESYEKALKNLETAKAIHHIEAIEFAEKEVKKYSSVAILEDDSGFGILDPQGQVSKEGVGILLRKALLNLPENWGMLYMVVSASEPTTKVSSHLYQLKTSWSTNAYVVNHTMYGPLVEHLKKIEDPLVTMVQPVDVEISNLHHLYKVYAIYPSIVFSQAGTSLITGKTWQPWQGQPVYPSQENQDPE